MKLSIDATPEELAELILQLTGKQEQNFFVSKRDDIKVVARAICDRQREAPEKSDS